MSVIKNKRTKTKVSNTMEAQEPITASYVDGKLLPDVSHVDAGAVLAVDDDGEWAATALDTEALYIINTVGPPTPTGLDKTFEEIKAALSAGKIPVVKQSTGGNYVFQLTNYTITGNINAQVFTFRHYNHSVPSSAMQAFISVTDISISGTGSFTYNSYIMANVFSTTEVSTRELWIDGKAIYRKTVTHSVTGVATYGDLPANANVIRADIIYTKTDDGLASSMNYAYNGGSNGDFAYTINVSTGNVTYDTKSYAEDIIATFYYTKIGG